MTDKEKDVRIAQLEDALLMCNNLWNDEIAARKRVEDQHIALVRTFLFKIKSEEHPK